jgi:hypothetical protein
LVVASRPAARANGGTVLSAGAAMPRPGSFRAPFFKAVNTFARTEEKGGARLTKLTAPSNHAASEPPRRKTGQPVASRVIQAPARETPLPVKNSRSLRSANARPRDRSIPGGARLRTWTPSRGVCRLRAR